MTILVTGASSGFGKAICQKFVQAGYQVIGAARRLDKLALLEEELGTSFYPLEMDISDPNKIQTALSSLPSSWQDIELLVNNAGLALGLEPAHQANFADWQTMINTNVTGLVYLTRQILPTMVERNKGHVINMGSIAGTYAYPGGNVYGATKAFVEQFSLNLRADLAGTAIRVTNVEPGLCGGTEFSNLRFKGDNAKAANVYQGVEYIQPEDIANTVLWIYQQPAHVNINRIEIMPVAQSFSALSIKRNS
ncbi:NADP-dependent 3-hydroxy acid dehydrogenase [Canicola haemoglobinophilus]|uniref:L-allo-threonine dehydrogenase, NAD(P)-binding n=1 Tax=Canicola haemoglobinophilus TaxID=733 RepID=A0A1V4B182_9PAST|nr:SDR family oxidoreductase [Canicola haemoglobinophilus]OOS00670.1 NADP-dependent 3-hydroxy acid dehydrogenase [Canicola haemoglobinophilus]STO54338.1 L-allo-threonine dehydrogenase, NAD(P)-binding [Canicola haemoglobinophilus]STO60192.1 L-allo-threonine dehydrogenase, NAD(P)-binding [Canicola haemoglobinophilus]STO68872.1 L-allo-threonine dehydrogenase, NAD(P)-binding [Canicola haemoglobinophilus]